MSRSSFIDPSTLTRSERIVAVFAWLGVVNAIIPWWYRVTTTGGDLRRFNAGVDWTGVAAWICFGAAALLVLVRAWIWPEPAPHRDGAAYLIFGVTALAALSIQSVTHKAATTGFYLAVFLAIGLAVGGAMRRRERLSGWR